MSSFSGTISSGATIERASKQAKALRTRRGKKALPSLLPSKRTLTERNEAILKYLPTIKKIAFRVSANRNGAIPRDGLVNAGVIGLIEAFNKFDSQKNVRFKTYAEYRIRGAMLDELRSLDFASRGMRLKSKRIERVRQKLTHESLVPAGDEDMARALGLSLGKYYDQVNSVRFDIVVASDYVNDAFSGLPENERLGLLSKEQGPDPFFLYARKENRRILAQAIDRLGQRERMVITLYYYEELTMREIADIMDFTESRVCQIHREAINKIKSQIGEWLHENRC